MLKALFLCSLCFLTYSCKWHKEEPSKHHMNDEPGLAQDPEKAPKQDTEHKGFGTKRSGPKKECSFR